MLAAYLRPLTAFTALVAAVSAVIVLGATDEQDFAQMSIATLVVTAACVVLVAQTWRLDFTRAPLLWLVLFAFFHFGLVWTLGLLGEERVAQVSATALYWIRTPYLRPAVTLAAIGAVAYAVVVSLLRPSERLSRERVALRGAEQEVARRLSKGGMVLQVGGVGVLGFAVARTGGLSILSGGYLAFLESAQDSLTGYAIWAVGVGSGLTQIGGARVRRAGVAVFISFALVLFPLGLRGSVLFPAAVLLATRSLIGRRTPAAFLYAGAVTALVASAVVRTTRVGGSSSGEGILGGVISTITELGFSLRPTAEVMRWADGGEPPSWFISFVAVPIRLVESLTGWNGGAPADDHRLFNVKINDLVGAIGGSPVAEGYDAARTLGVVVVLGTIGLVLARAARGPFDTGRRLAMFPVIVLPLTVAVRNSFAPVIPQVALGLVVVVALTRRRSSRGNERTPQSPEQSRPAKSGPPDAGVGSAHVA